MTSQFKPAALFFCLALTGCAGLAGSGDTQPIPFSDTNGRLHTASFMTAYGGDGKIAGEVTISNQFSLNIVRMNADLSIAIRDHAGNSRAENLKALANAKSFTAYVFSKNAGTIEVNHVRATHGICTDYRSKGVAVKIADNMYYQGRHQNQNRFVFRSSGVAAKNPANRSVQSATLDFSAATGIPDNIKTQWRQNQAGIAEAAKVHHARLNELLAVGICP
ncbi:MULTISPECIES: hypothetical protein [Eikenella]|uniref:DUF8095 domain-containing protein n=1 Tax=Eikenella longinqua TaxID=1795827 RepID=A0A1A9RW89_9NEIS|nr:MULTISPECIES: hypothetical protein [Eikenella]OAM26413.1 hypothetical protein A7P95_09545 [Eikenella longinqua]